MATWREINDALSVDTGEHVAQTLHVTIEGGRVACSCGVTFASSDKFDACNAWFEHRAQRAAFPESQAVSRG